MAGTQQLSIIEAASGKLALGQRISQIDGLRAIAALSVVVFHYTTRFDQIFHHVPPTQLSFSFGYLGVNLFFAISGFVIYMTLDRIHAPLDFVISRFSRLFPTYWVAVALTWTIVTVVGLHGYGVTWKEAIINLSMLQSFFSVRDVDSVYWSLQVEFLFYVWMLVLWVTRLLRYSVEICVAWVVLAGTMTLLDTFWSIKFSFTLRHFLLLEWIPWFALGMTAYLTRRDRVFYLKHGTLVLIAIVAIAAQNKTPMTIAAVGVFALVWAASRGKLSFLESKPMVFLGMISYPLYLVHEQIGWIIISKLEALFVTPLVAIMLAIACTVSLATLLHQAVEIPSSSGIRRIYKNSRYAISARTFSRPHWAIGCMASMLVLAAGLIISARM